MKRLCCLLLAILTFSFCFSQQKAAKVTLKAGTTITGTIIELNPASHLVIQVAGYNTRIGIGDISSIEDISSNEIISLPEAPTSYPIIDNQSKYPDSYIIKVGPYTIEMILVHGATFNMGYDGNGSLRMNSEPIHKVRLNSFYVNKAPISKDLVTYLKKGTEKHSNKHYSPWSEEDAISIANAIAYYTNRPFHLITEAQCEYVLSSGIIKDFTIVNSRDGREMVWCHDIFADYSQTAQPQVDPVGPKTGRFHVIRDFASSGNGIYHRYTYLPHREISGSIRISILASELLQDNNNVIE